MRSPSRGPSRGRARGVRLRHFDIDAPWIRPEDRVWWSWKREARAILRREWRARTRSGTTISRSTLLGSELKTGFGGLEIVEPDKTWQKTVEPRPNLCCGFCERIRKFAFQRENAEPWRFFKNRFFAGVLTYATELRDVGLQSVKPNGILLGFGVRKSTPRSCDAIFGTFPLFRRTPTSPCWASRFRVVFDGPQTI